MSREALRREPPYSEALEQAVLAACLLEGGQASVRECLELKLTERSFYLPAHQAIFKACCFLFEKGTAVNVLTVGDYLNRSEQLNRVGGYPYLHAITDRIQSPVGLSGYAKTVKNLEIARNLAHFLQESLENVYSNLAINDELDPLLDTIEHRVLEINQERVEQSALPFKVPLAQAMTGIQQLLETHGVINGISSGFKDLDVLTNGFHPGEMIVIAARPSMGKTALALNIAESAVLQKTPIPTLFFSLEMSAVSLAMRVVGSYNRIDMTKLRSGYLNVGKKKAIAQMGDRFQELPFWIDESSDLTILQMKAKARRLHAEHHLGLIVIDYLQLLSGTDPRMPREQQIAEISRGIKGMAKELNIPVLVLSQLNRESEREARQPRLSDLRESGAIEQDADLVLLLSKKIDAVKNNQWNNGQESQESEADDAHVDTVVRDLIVAKQRNGPCGIVRLSFLQSYMRFENYMEQKGSMEL